jgi:large subunit ribosomal protein L6
MSRLAKKPVEIPQGVTVTEKGRTLVVKGPKGELTVAVPQNIAITLEPTGMTVATKDSSKQARANSGTVWSLTRNAIAGVTGGFEKILEIEGVGFRAQMEGTATLVLSLGYVNPVRVPLPAGVTAVVEKNTIKVTGMDKETVGQFAAVVRSLKKPEPYKGKGIRYRGEVIKRKVGKKAAAAA